MKSRQKLVALGYFRAPESPTRGSRLISILVVDLCIASVCAAATVILPGSGFAVAIIWPVAALFGLAIAAYCVLRGTRTWLVGVAILASVALLSGFVWWMLDFAESIQG